MSISGLEISRRRRNDLVAVSAGSPVPPWLSWGRSFLTRLFSIGFCLILWQLASEHHWNFLINFSNVPCPAEVSHAAVRFFHSSKVLDHILSSLRRIFVGFGLAAFLAVGLGLFIGRSRLARDFFMPPFELLRPIPAVAWIPLAILMFFSPEGSMIFITFIGAFFPILLNTIHGVASIDRRLLFASMTLGASPLAIFFEVIFPGALPSIVTGLSIGMGTSWFSLVTAEMISGQYGIGYYTWEAYTLQNYPDIVLGMIAIGVLGLMSSYLIMRLGRFCMPWLRAGGGAL
jgi:NitT/TauT family transport system permease protein